MSLYFNEIEGTLPPDASWPSSLTYLSLGSNLLTGSLPLEWGGLLPLSLQMLYVDDNFLSGN